MEKRHIFNVKYVSLLSGNISITVYFCCHTTSRRASSLLPTQLLSTATLDSTTLNGNTLLCTPLCLFLCVRNAFVQLDNNDSPAFCVNGAV